MSDGWIVKYGALYISHTLHSTPLTPLTLYTLHTLRLSHSTCHALHTQHLSYSSPLPLSQQLHSHKEQKISAKVDKSTAVMALDVRTRLMLYKLVNSGAVAEVHGTISTGKESVVIYAKGGLSVA